LHVTVEILTPFERKKDPTDILQPTEELCNLKARSPNSMRIKGNTAYENVARAITRLSGASCEPSNQGIYAQTYWIITSVGVFGVG
jgi:hypothetical protein